MVEQILSNGTYPILYFLMRLIVAGPLALLIARQFHNLYHVKQVNGLNKTRKALLLFTIGMAGDVYVRLPLDIAAIVLGINVQHALSHVQPLLFLAYVLRVIGVIVYFVLFCKGAYGKEKQSH